MANTKKLDPKARKRAKRLGRRAFRAKIAALSMKERKELRKFEGTPAKFLAKLAADKAAAATATQP